MVALSTQGRFRDFNGPMTDPCCQAPGSRSPPTADYARVLWIALGINVVLFAVEAGSSLRIGSASLLADAVDFAGDAANYALSLGALAVGSAWRSRSAMLKGCAMFAYGIGVLAFVAWSIREGVTPQPLAMGAVGSLALAANVAVAMLLFRFRAGDADMRAVWLCSRNDVIGNLAVVAAAFGVFGAQSGWPDRVVGAAMGFLALLAGTSVVRHAAAERRLAREPAG